MSKETKPKKKMGRPVGSRNKSALDKAQEKLDSLMTISVDSLEAIIKGDSSHFNSEEKIPFTVILGAIKVAMDKSIANEKEKEAVKPTPQEKKPTGPKIFTRAASKDSKQA